MKRAFGLFLAVAAGISCVRAGALPVGPDGVPARLPQAVLPEVAFVIMTDDALTEPGHASLERLFDVLHRWGTYNTVTFTSRTRHDDTEQLVKDAVADCVRMVHARGMKFVMDVDPRHCRTEFLRRFPQDAQQLVLVEKSETNGVTVVCPRLTDHMSSNGAYAPLSNCLQRAYAVRFDPSGRLLDRRDVTASARHTSLSAGEVRVSCDGLKAGESLVAQVLFTLRSCDVRSERLLPFMEALTREYAALGVDGVFRDEYGFPPTTREFDAHRAYWYSRPLAAAYRRATGRELADDVVKMAYACGEADRSQAVRAYLRLILDGCVAVERAFAEMHGKVFGASSPVFKHPTWYPTLGPREMNHNGLDWWLAPRGWAQVDEETYPCAALGMCKKFGGANWLCEGYQREAARYAPFVWRYALAGGRMVYHPVYPGNGPRYAKMSPGDRIVKTHEDILDAGAGRAQRCVRLLNRISAAPIASPVAVVFGHFACMDWTSPAYCRWGFELTRDLWRRGWLSDLYPSTEIAEGTFVADADGTVRVGAQRYAAVVFVNVPEEERRAFERRVAGTSRTARFVDPPGIEPICRALEGAKAVRQPPLACAAAESYGWKTFLPEPDGTVTLTDGTVARIKASGPDWSGDILDGVLTIGGVTIRYKARGVFAARLGRDGRLEAVAGADVTEVRAPGFVFSSERPVELCLPSIGKGTGK